MHILIVEDNEININLISRRLKKHGFIITTAVDGEQALGLVEDLKPDIVLLDMSLPKMDGWDVARALKSNPKVKHIPIVALTAHAMQGDREKAIASGCDEYETKPIQMDGLLEKINSFKAS